MSKNQRIPRPRHLFPELAAFLIEWKRSNLRAGRSLRRAIGHVPIWVTGSLAGVLGIMFCVSLFFISEPQLQAAATPVILPPVNYSPPPPIPSTRTVPAAPRSNLQVRILHTEMQGAFDENRVSTLKSSATPLLKASQLLQNDRWLRAQNRESFAKSFSSYLIRAAGWPSDWPQLLASNVVSRPLVSPVTRTMGIEVEKIGNMNGTPNEPLTYEISIRNSNAYPIEDLRIYERISTLTRVTDVTPIAGILGDDLVWKLDSIASGEVKTLRITLIPEYEGIINTITKVVPTSRVSGIIQVRAAAAPAMDVRPIAPAEPTRVQPEVRPPAASEPTPLIQVVPGAPELKLAYTDLKTLRQGDTLSMIFSVTNVGTATAEDVQLYVRLSGQFEHRYGEFVKHQIGNLQPGQTRRALLQATARDPGDAFLDASLTMQGTKKEVRELRIPIQGGPPQPARQQPIAQKPVFDMNSAWVALEPKASQP